MSLTRALLDQKSGATSIITQIGNTPLLQLKSLEDRLPTGVEIFAKAEYLNPGGSVKDRAAWSMIQAAEKSGQLTPEKTILDATSGNTGIAYALIGASRGYKVALCLPAHASEGRKRILKAFGAEIILTDPLEGTDGAQRKAKELSVDTGRYFYPDQYNNPANWQAHYESTAPEIWLQTRGRVTHFVAGLGTTGTFVGTTRGLRRFFRDLTAVAMQPDNPMHGVEGMKHLATAMVPGIYDANLANETVEISTEEAQEMTRHLAKREGLFVGVSSGGNVAAALQVGRRLPVGSVVVTILCDTGSRDLSETFWHGDGI